MAPVLRLLLVAAALLPTATSASLNETTYVVTVSSVLTGGKQETLCAQIQNPTARLSLTISLALDTTSSIILQQSITQNFYTCVRFKVPLVLVNTVATIQVSLQDEATSVNKTTKVMIEPPDIIHLIQTDKPIYKPGQTVQFRIVSMDVNFLPVDQVVCSNHCVQDPNTNRIAQWLNKTIVGVGILDFSFLIIPEAAQGTYTITAVTDKGEEINNNFDIKEYVLPKYEVNIFLPSVITILDKEATVKICGNEMIWLKSCLFYSIFQIRVTGPNDQPIANEVVYLYVEDSTKITLSTDLKGLILFSLDTTYWKNSVSLRVCSSLFLFKEVLWRLNKGELRITLNQVLDLAPYAQVVVYTLMPSGELVADSQDFPIQLCLKNQVSLKFSSLQVLPAEKTTLTLKASPKSLCSVRAIDQSVLLLKPEQELTVDYNIGVKLVTNSDVRKPQECFFWKFDGTFFIYFAPPGAGIAQPETKKTVRTFFPETWIWDLVPVGDNGSVNVVKKAPDTITKWAAGAFCVSPVGFGVAPNTGITVFQPFFVSLTLPYSVIRGEVFTLRATVFNYLSNCIMVKVTLADSDQFTYRACEGCQYSVCVCSEETRTFSWIVTPKVLGDVSLKVSAEALKTRALCGNKVTTLPDVGRVDTVIQTLLVEAEGTPQMVGYNALLCPPSDISLQLPEAFVPGSARASVSVLGDLMGRAMKNLDQLLAMPYGCGEQNMILFAPNIFILNYLKSSGQLTLPILDRAKVFLESGYQRELTYKHTDGSYSAFGMSDDSGNTWLTSFVMKSFGGASSYIFIDSVYINDARTWLSQLQKKDGCIRSVGNLIHTDLKGGVNDEVTLTAYVAAAMLELDGNSTDPVVESCLKCLTAAVNGQLDNLYTVALLSYTFSLAGDQEMRSKLITHLDQKAITDGGSRHWEYSSGSDSLNIELTSYVLLSLLTSPPLENFGLDYCSGIVRWLVQVQNPFGGFSSTQDTVVALEALAKYAAATYSPQSTTTVTVTSSGGLNKVFVVNQDNRLLYQEEQLSEVPGDYNITAKGQSCVLTQVRSAPAHTATQTTLAKCNAARPQLILYVTVRYRGSREETNMVLIDIKLLSGYVLDGSSLDQVSKAPAARVDADAGHISIYLDGKEQTQMYSVTLEDDQHVRNLKPAVVKVYDYYQTSDKGVTEYTSPCAAST
uniref:Alpha-2-macroglobulin-like protein 1 n=1 Tax=Nothobranchius furzeri TaxID=105023 RepID=A0A8C6L8S2_NOTFU